MKKLNGISDIKDVKSMNIGTEKIESDIPDNTKKSFILNFLNNIRTTSAIKNEEKQFKINAPVSGEKPKNMNPERKTGRRGAHS